MKQFIFLLLFLSLSPFYKVSCQEIIDNYLENKTKYEKKSRIQIKKSIKRQDTLLFLDNIEFQPIPSFRLKIIDSLNYLKIENLLYSILLDNNISIHTILMFENKHYFIGFYSCSDRGNCKVSLYNDCPEKYEKMNQRVDKINYADYNLIFYLQGISDAWWFYLKGKLMVYSFSDEQLYNGQEFWDKFNTNDNIKKLIEFYQ